MQKALLKFKHRKIVFVKVESSITRKRSLIQKYYWDPNKQSTKRQPVNISFSNN